MAKTKKRKYIEIISAIIIVILLFPQKTYSFTKLDTEETARDWLSQFIKLENKTDIASIFLNNEIVLFTAKSSDKEQNGYVILKINSENTNQHEIIEYGIGEYVPYHQEIIMDEKIKKLTPTNFLYASPFEGYWIFAAGAETVYIDGATGDWLPDLEDFKSINYGNNKHFFITDQVDKPVYYKELIFDPLTDLSWLLSNEQGSLSAEELKVYLNRRENVQFTGTKYNNKVYFAYSIIGYQTVGENFYVAVFDNFLETIRFIPYELMIKFGHFSLPK